MFWCQFLSLAPNNCLLSVTSSSSQNIPYLNNSDFVRQLVRFSNTTIATNTFSTLILILQGILPGPDSNLAVLRCPTSNDKNEKIPLLKQEIIMNVEEFPKRRDRRYLTRGLLSCRPAIFMVVSVAVCLGVCVSVLHHHGRVSELALSIRRCLFNY